MFPLQSHALPTELSKEHYFLPKVIYMSKWVNLSVYSITWTSSGNLSLRVECPVRGEDSRRALWHVSWLPALLSARHSENCMKKEKEKKMIQAGMERASMRVDVVSAKNFHHRWIVSTSWKTERVKGVILAHRRRSLPGPA